MPAQLRPTAPTQPQRGAPDQAVLDPPALSAPAHADLRPRAVHMPAELYSRLLRQARQLNRAGLKAYGLLAGDPDHPGFPYRADDVVVLDPHRNRRNDPSHRAAFHAQGSYFRAYEDAGFVADPTDVLHAWQHIERTGLEPVAAFHVHRRQPANFSSIDYRLHNPAFPWHLIISLRDPGRPDVRPFLISKDPDHLGIDETDDLEGSELSYAGPGVTPATLVLTGVAGPDDLRDGWRIADQIGVESGRSWRSA